MSKIQLLDQNTINKIAAGEVVERPAAVVKELIENAIDAGSNAVTCEIKEGGISFIRITDNGSGIPKEDIDVAFLRHATSKIRSVEDLLSVSSLGFRGEALASIASVAQVELLTKTSADTTGIRYMIEGGIKKSVEDIGCPNGTTFIVRNLFFNTPARRKFLKSAMTEAGYINDLMMRLAVSHPDVSFKFIVNNQIKLHTSGNNNLKDILYTIYGREIAASLVEVSAQVSDIKIHGYIGKPIISRGNRTYENYYINGRYIRSGIICKAIEEAYRPFIMAHKYPFTALHYEINSDLIDVNVHPTKLEIRFRNGDHVFKVTEEAISEALSTREMIPEIHLEEKKEKQDRITKAPEPFELNRRNQESNFADSAKKVNGSENSARNQHPFYKETPEILADTEIGKLNHIVRNAYDVGSHLQEGKKEVHPEEVVKKPNLFEQLRKKREELNQGVAESEDSAMSQNDPGQSLTREDSRVIQDEKAEETVPVDSSEKMEPASISDSDKWTQESKTSKKTKISKETDESENAENQVITTGDQMSLSEAPFLSKQARKQHQIIGQLFNTYWIVEYDQKMFIIDQHAAHEKVLYEKTMKKVHESSQLSQMIHPPIIVSFTMREEETYLKHKDVFSRLGFEIEPFGGKEYSVRAVPSDMLNIADEDLLLEIIDQLVDDNYEKDTESVLEKVASMSCKAAIKGNMKLSYQEADHLIDQLLELENPYHCPHGRPVIISMSKYEIEKKFKRII